MYNLGFLLFLLRGRLLVRRRVSSLRSYCHLKRHPVKIKGEMIIITNLVSPRCNYLTAPSF